MNWTLIEAQWDRVAHVVKWQWSRLTDDDLKNIAGNKEQLVGKLQQHYGILKEDAENQIDKWIAKINPLCGTNPRERALSPKP